MQAQFVEYYLIYLNATKAAKAAGYSAKTAYSQGQRLLKHVEVSAAIKEAMDARSKRTHVDADFVITRLAAIAGAQLRDFTEPNENGDVVIHQWDKDDPLYEYALDEISQTVSKDGGSVKIKLADRMAALKMLGNHLGLSIAGISEKGNEDDPDGEGAGASKRTRESVTSGLSGSIGRLRLARGT